MAPRSKKSKGGQASTKEEPVKEEYYFREKLGRMMDPQEVDDSPNPPYTAKEPLAPKDAEEDRKLFEAAQSSRMFQFLLKSEEKTAQEMEQARRENLKPLHKEDAAMWKKLPPVPAPWGGPPLVRKAIKTPEEGRDKFHDFFRQFHFGLWGYRQRPYPEEKPFDVQQALGFKWLHKRYFDFAMRGGGWYYKDRLGRTRGPMELVNMKTAWAAGIMDKNTFIWGDDMDEWAPIGMVYGLERAIATPDVRLATLGTKIMHRIARGMNPFRPRKGYEMKSYKQLQDAALARRDREQNVLRNNEGVWPGERIPSHVLGLWAGGSQLTNWLEDSTQRGGKFIPYDIRKRLAQEIPGLRPWEVLDVEQVWDLVTFHRDFYRRPLGSLTGPPDYEIDYFNKTRETFNKSSQIFREAFGKNVR